MKSSNQADIEKDEADLLDKVLVVAKLGIVKLAKVRNKTGTKVNRKRMRTTALLKL